MKKKKIDKIFKKKYNFHFLDILHVWVISNFRPFRSTRLSFREKWKKNILKDILFFSKKK